MTFQEAIVIAAKPETWESQGGKYGFMPYEVLYTIKDSVAALCDEDTDNLGDWIHDGLHMGTETAAELAAEWDFLARR